jgi:penicillin-binding protein 2
MASDPRATRLAGLGMAVLVLFGLLGVRLWFLQVRDAPALQERVQANRSRTVMLQPERGRIFDRDGRVLADNARLLVVSVDRSSIADDVVRNALFERLSGALGVPVEEMERRYGSPRYDPFRALPVAEGVNETQAMFITERIEDYPGVQVEIDWQREYPFAPLASHVVGYLGAITVDEAETYKALGYQLNERVGRFGLEKSYETLLRGTPGRIVYEVDARGSVIGVIERVEPIPGNDLLLSLDLDLQQLAEQALETQLRFRRQVRASQYLADDGQPVKPQFPPSQNLKAPAGSVVVMDHSNGQVMAMASYPTFDNRWFNASVGGSKFAEIFPSENPDGTRLDPDLSSLTNRAIQGQYNVGSTFKPFVAYAALASGLLPEGADYRYPDTGVYRLRSIDPFLCEQGVKCDFRNAICPTTGKPCMYGNVNVTDSLAVSVDTFFYRIGEEIFLQNDGRPVLQNQVRKFGFGADTGIDLPYEFDGRVPDKDSKRELYDRGVLAEGESADYLVGDNVQLSIGQGLLAATPIQLTVGYGALANGGTVHRPRVVAAVLAPSTPESTKQGFADLGRATIVSISDEPARSVSLPPRLRDPIVAGLERVVTPGGGVRSDFYHSTTGERLFRDYDRAALPIAGKTGTAQGAANLPWNDSSVWSSFSLDPDRPFTVTAYLEKSGYGSQAAAPIAKCVFLALQGRLPLTPVTLSEELDVTSSVAAFPRTIPDAQCLAPPVRVDGARE